MGRWLRELWFVSDDVLDNTGNEIYLPVVPMYCRIGSKFVYEGLWRIEPGYGHGMVTDTEIISLKELKARGKERFIVREPLKKDTKGGES